MAQLTLRMKDVDFEAAKAAAQAEGRSLNSWALARLLPVVGFRPVGRPVVRFPAGAPALFHGDAEDADVAGGPVPELTMERDDDEKF